MFLNAFRGSRALALAGVVMLLGAALVVQVPADFARAQEAVKTPDTQRKAEEKPEAPPSRSAEIRKLLGQPTDKVKQGIDPGQTLKDVLEFLGRSHGLTFRVDVERFKQQGADNVEDKQLPRGLPATREISLGMVLQDLLNQIEPVQASYLVRREHITIVPMSYLQAGLPLEMIHVDFTKRALGEALWEVADLTGASIVLDAKRAGEKANTTITASFRQTPLVTAVALLANMAELQAVRVANLYYITSPENAAKLIEQGLAIPANVPGIPAGL